MKKIRYFFALYAAKACQFLLKLLGRNATFFPGKVAVKLCKDFLAHIKPPKLVIAVTGTNGKTTVSNLMTSILKEAGYRVTNNSFGSNVQAGVISALVEDTDLLGRPKKDIAVLEVDERSSLLIYPYLQPDYLLCNNIMRDSLKRNAHTEFISYIITSALPAKTRLILNADDLICSGLGAKDQDRTFFGIEAEKPEVSEPQAIRDIVYCPNCGELLKDEYVRYNHIGRHFCDNCGFHSPDPDYAVTAIDRSKNTFTVSHNNNNVVFKLINDNLVNIYNSCGVIALLSEIGLSMDSIRDGFEKAKIVKTRLDTATAGDLNITLLMSKGQNPMACGRCFDYVAKVPCENKGVIIIVDDIVDNTNDSESSCWLYDCDFSPLKHPSIAHIIFGGPRCKDHYMRASLAGINMDKVTITESCTETACLLDINRCKNIFVLHDLTRPADAKVIKDTLIARGLEAAK